MEISFYNDLIMIIDFKLVPSSCPRKTPPDGIEALGLTIT